MPSQGTGANVEPRSLKSSIDLATVIELLAQAISPSSNQANTNQLNPKGMQLFEFDEKQNKRLRISTSAVMYRLFAQPKFREAFNPAPGSGFIQNLSMPSYGNRSRVGGCLSDGNATKLPGAIDRLMAAIDQALNTAVPSESLLSTLLLDEAEQQLKHLAKKAGTSFQNIANTANLVHLAFQSGDTKDNKSVATVICARERVENTDYFEQMCSAATEYLENELGNDEDDVNSSIATLKEEKNRYDSQIQRFLNFIDDEALSRVRLTISFRIMEAIAENARSSNDPDYQLLVEYVNRILTLVESAKEEGYTVDLTAHFGSAAEFDLADELSKATFYYCLAVWPEWKTQIFEQKTKNQVEREVSYRFRVNGQNPELGKPAFEVRLDQIREYLLSNDESSLQKPWEICRRLAQLIFLAVVVPKKDEEPLTKESLTDVVNQLLANFKSQGTEAIRQTLEELQERSESMKSIAKALKEVLRDRNQKVISQVQDRSSQQFICVKSSIINWDRLEGATLGVRKLLVEPQENSSEKVEWFKHIEICEQPATSGLLFSVKVTAELSEYDLKTKDTLSQLWAKRLLPQKLLQVCWVPRSWEKKDDQWTYELSTNASKAAGWVLPAAVIVEYDVKTVKRQPDTKGSEEKKQYHAAAVTAFAVLVYCCLWRIIRRLQQRDQEKSVDFTTLMLRLQEKGKELDDNNDEKEKSGDAYIYAAAQTLEAILAEDTPIRMQGLILENLAKQTDTTKFIKSGTFKALLSAFPICISSPGSDSVRKIGLISYASRPCNEGNFPNDSEKAYLFLTQSYIATAVNEPFQGYELKRERMQSDVLDSPEQLKTQRLVQEEIRHLKAQGCQHIILLAHAYGDRRINRAANYNSSLRDTEFLEEVSQTFPDINIYPMVRDVFPATRLRDRGYNEAAFEILQAGDHSNFQRSVRADDFRDFIPVYTFATLYAIQAEERIQSGFCIYFLVSDAKVSDINWTERARLHLINPEQKSPIHDCLLAVLRGLHFIEAERGVQKGQLIPVLDPFSWISPNTVEEAGEVKVLHTRRKGQVLLNYRAVLTHVSQVLHRK
ncbi:hypothetical protein [Nostoc sp. 'Peltigera membranacea cyanobiont' 232]|uniref:hypothetical protein n=1 Tax=Nostoc sp. 'Peltigera membranacea cyanobiont' 232 TaxID=2014531 RepID=UPI000B954ADE|nr:hypothetical protein [Nostoc sp. 'Peltigera membranacea cyanobiont' 232]OYE06293.1 hypothetical protein CDG79_02920 [Nostoc sp. 'Peltigera membranacea cyanobiont' 232]